MRNYIILAMLAVGLVSCSKESPLSEKSKEMAAANQQKWVLVKTTNSFGMGSTTGNDMPWQEQYIFNADGTFSKTRILSSASKTANGSYTLVKESDQEFLELTYLMGSELRASCYEKERLLKSAEGLLEGTWGHCDGPTLEYAKANETGQ